MMIDAMKNNSGFTLVEVLIAVLVLSLGLLGMAGLQATSLKNNQSAYNRGLATQLAYDIADRMRANRAGLAAYTAIPPTAAQAKPNCLNLTGCTPANMAENDLFEWNRSLASLLPSAIGAIAVAGSTFTVTINWDDNRDGDVDGDVDDDDDGEDDIDGDSDTDHDPNFQTSFQL